MGLLQGPRLMARTTKSPIRRNHWVPLGCRGHLGSVKCNTTLLYKKAKMLFGPYFHEKTWSAASYCSLKVTKPPESFKIEAKYAKVCFLWQGLIPGLLRGSQVS